MDSPREGVSPFTRTVWTGDAVVTPRILRRSYVDASWRTRGIVQSP